MIEVSGLWKSYGELDALSNVSFKVEKGQIVGFLGANGAGKSTTMDILCGCIGADRGTANVAGYDITDAPLEAKRRLGYLPDVAPLHLDMMVGDYIAYAAELRKISRTAIKGRVDSTIEKLTLGDVRNRIIGNLSKGFRQRVGLAQALVHDPDVLILDEPTEGLDPTQISEIRKLIRSLGGQHTILLSSHILSEVQNTCDKIIIINKGKIVTQGTYAELASSMESGHVYKLKVARNGSNALTTLGRLGLQNIQAIDSANASSSSEIEFEVNTTTGDQVLDDVAKAVVDGGFGLRGLTLKTKSLEDVFLQLTK
jgi:ABC-2 type transport system ATP-binding protein